MRSPIYTLLVLGLAGCSTTSDVEPPATTIASTSETKTDPTPRDARLTRRGEGPMDNARMERLAKTDPVTFLEESHKRYDREVRCYRVTLVKHEFITPPGGTGKLNPVEEIDAWFREKPYSVRMDWRKGANLASRTLFVKGENNDQLLARPTGLAGWLGIFRRSPHSEDAKSTSRYPITEFGIKAGSQNTLRAWQAAQKRGELKVDFQGEAAPSELGGRPCWKLHRVALAPEEDGIITTTFYFDKENWLQIGSVLEDKDGKLIASYYFRDLKINVDLPADVFTIKGLKK